MGDDVAEGVHIFAVPDLFGFEVGEEGVAVFSEEEIVLLGELSSSEGVFEVWVESVEFIDEVEEGVEYVFIEFNYEFFEVEVDVISDYFFSAILIDGAEDVHDEDVVVFVDVGVELLASVDETW